MPLYTYVCPYEGCAKKESVRHGMNEDIELYCLHPDPESGGHSVVEMVKKIEPADFNVRGGTPRFHD